jgi:RNA polymerase sigma-70 factor (ECF subfamily)
VDRDERELVQRCLRRDQDACAELVNTHARMVGTVIWRATGVRDAVEDLAQETFLRVFRGLGYFDRRAKLSTWIYTIAHRVAIDYRRQTGRWREQMGEHDETADAVIDRLPARESDPETVASREELERIVRDELAQLPDKYRLALSYATLDALDYDTIASMLGVKAATVKTLVFRGKQLLKARVERVVQTPAHNEGPHAI